VDSKTNAVFLTGATGFVGMELLARYLERTDRRVYALVRGADDHEVQARMQRTLLGLFGPASPYADRVVAVRGDVTRPGLGVPGGLDWLLEQLMQLALAAEWGRRHITRASASVRTTPSFRAARVPRAPLRPFAGASPLVMAE
jgi:nucleoside-diphosphate-sugar epimerase